MRSTTTKEAHWICSGVFGRSTENVHVQIWILEVISCLYMILKAIREELVNSHTPVSQNLEATFSTVEFEPLNFSNFSLGYSYKGLFQKRLLLCDLKLK